MRACRCVGACVCSGDAITKKDRIYPEIHIRGFGNISLGTKTADHKKRTDVRRAIQARYMEEARDRPEDFSDVIPYKEVGDWLLGRKIEIWWWVGDEEKEEHLHCFEGTVREIIPYSEDRENYSDFRKCKHTVVKVEWDEVFNMHPGYVPLNPDRYAAEKGHLGWSVLDLDYVAYARDMAKQLKELGVDAWVREGAGPDQMDAEAT